MYPERIAIPDQVFFEGSFCYCDVSGTCTKHLALHTFSLFEKKNSYLCIMHYQNGRSLKRTPERRVTYRKLSIK